MELAVFIPISAILGTAWVAVTWLRYRQERLAAAGAGETADAALAGENRQLRATVSRLEERIAVLERIATDPAERTAREIEQLRA